MQSHAPKTVVGFQHIPTRNWRYPESSQYKKFLGLPKPIGYCLCPAQPDLGNTIRHRGEREHADVSKAKATALNEGCEARNGAKRKHKATATLLGEVGQRAAALPLLLVLSIVCSYENTRYDKNRIIGLSIGFF
eukprot:3766627-Pleurochrysis_carterae.AAC.1